MRKHRWIRLIVPGFLLAILMAVTIESSVLAQECIDPVTKKVIPCPATDGGGGGGGGGGNKKPTPSPYPSFTPTSTNTPTATITSSPTNTPDGAAVGEPDHGQAAPQAGSAPPPASFDKGKLFGSIVIGSLLVILIGLLLPGLRRGFGRSTKASPTPPPPGKGSGDGEDRGIIKELTKHQRENLRLIQRFSDALREGHIWSFIESDEVRRFIDDAKRGVFGGNVPDGTPGSKFPGTGGQDPFDVLDGLFRGPAFGLGRIDHSGGGDPAQAPEGTTYFPDGSHLTVHTDPETGDRVSIQTTSSGNIQIWTSHTNGSADGFQINHDGSYSTVHEDNVPNHSRDINAGIRDANATYTEVDTHWGANRRDMITVTFQTVNGVRGPGVSSGWYRPNSPGEDGREANTARNPLNNLDIIGPRSMWEMTEMLRHPGSDTEQHDPNTGMSGLQLTDAQRERLGRIAPAAEVLDPNNGIDPLTGLHLDPNQMQRTHTEDDELDPNDGRDGPLPLVE